ncbi:MAG TPA: glycosyltransferase [Rhizomicrobium sp.]
MIKVAIVATNNDKVYSGGRYHALIMAYALAMAGDDVHFITNKKPVFFDDLEPIAPGRVRFTYTGDFVEKMPKDRFDFVILIPTGVFQPEYYEAALRFARGARARIALLNFESENWFNTYAPAPRDPRLWDYWRRSLNDGGLILSSAMESQRHAEAFYTSDKPLRFEVVSPPINSLAADEARGMPKDGSVVAFVRASDIHKGGQDLLRLDPGLFEGRTLRIIAGGPLEGAFERALAARVEQAPNASLDVQIGVSDVEKFRLVASAQALLFPSRFEGFGYPPVEAAYAGTEVVCYDLPVLVETVGGVAHMAPHNDVTALGAKLAEALKMPPRFEELHDRVADRVSLQAASMRFHDALSRSLDVRRLPEKEPAKVLYGPWQTSTGPAPKNSEPGTLPFITHCALMHSGEAIVDVQVETARPALHIACTTEGVLVRDTCLRTIGIHNGRYQSSATMILPKDSIGKELAFAVSDEDTVPLLSFEFIVQASTASPTDQAYISIRSEGRDGTPLTGEFAGAGANGIDELAISVDGRNWRFAPVVNRRFSLRHPDPLGEDENISLYAFSGGAAVRTFGGFPLHEGGRRSGEIEPEAGETFDVAHLTNETWNRGVRRNAIGPYLGSIALNRAHEKSMPTPGSLVRLADGQIRVVEDARLIDRFPTLLFSRGVSPNLNGYPRKVEVIRTGTRNASLMRLNDQDWNYGLWTVAGTMRNAAVALPANGPRAGVGDVIRFANGTERRIAAVARDKAKQVLWLSSPVVRADILKNEVTLRADGLSQPRLFRISDRNDASWSAGIAVDGGRTVCVSAELEAVKRLQDTYVHFAHSGFRKVLDVSKGPDGLVSIKVDSSLDPQQDGYPNTLRMPSEAEVARRPSTTLKFGSPVRERDTQSPRRTLGEVLTRLRPPGDAARPRALFATLVPPLPADQGNRVVTRNLILHLLRRGFDVDVVLTGGGRPSDYWQEFGDRVRVFTVPFPDWAADPSIAARRSIVDLLRRTQFAESEAGVVEDLIDQAMVHHPYFIVPDAAVELAKSLYKAGDYQAIVCNYTHLIRIADELQAMGPLPPTVVITHDALSRLPKSFDGVPMDLMYRYCKPQIEKSVLDAVPGAAVLAISESEQSYFKEIGVKNPVLLCEFDALQECAPFQTTEKSFESNALIFHASANPMNIASLQWFLEKCWPDVLARVPTAKLLVAGKICKAMPGLARIPNVTLLNEMSRMALLQRLGTTTVAINPTVAGTGLKIKTVEAASLGLPSVCLPHAVEGLDTHAERFCILAQTPEEFTEGCVKLLKDRQTWTALRESTLEYAAERFSTEAIYSELDAQMGWQDSELERFQQPRLVLPDIQPESAPPADKEGADLRQLADRLLSLQQDESSAQVLDLYANRFGGSAADHLKNAEAALDGGTPSYAIDQALVSLEKGGSFFAAFDIIVRAYGAMNLPNDANEVARTLHLIAPLSPHLAAYRSLNPPADDHADITFPLELGKSVPPRYLVPVSERFGLGWGKLETWGVWTESTYARVKFQVSPAVRGPFQMDLTLHASKGGVSPMQTILIYANGLFRGRFEIPRDSTRVPVSIDIPNEGDTASRDGVMLELFVSDPAPYRKPDGSVTDMRQLGVALTAVVLRSMAEQTMPEPALAGVG